jgi:hypothetical protein
MGYQIHDCGSREDVLLLGTVVFAHFARFILESAVAVRSATCQESDAD